ncbi:nickel-responsive transcriptional regulator NikR [Candidatus Bipolaricaulota bacterium]|nr:nickel-responsive transcriptional regulator NikR [Candidatus Bipolaricaulota bacterium]
MNQTIRFSVSMEEQLVAALDEMADKRGYSCRSEAVRDAIRSQLVRDEWDESGSVVGVITLLYDHHTHGLSERLTQIQHQAEPCIISTTHIHLDTNMCLELVAVRGDAATIRTLADRLRSLKGVKHGGLSGTSTGIRLP